MLRRSQQSVIQNIGDWEERGLTKLTKSQTLIRRELRHIPVMLITEKGTEVRQQVQSAFENLETIDFSTTRKLLCLAEKVDLCLESFHKTMKYKDDGNVMLRYHEQFTVAHRALLEAARMDAMPAKQSFSVAATISALIGKLNGESAAVKAELVELAKQIDGIKNDSLACCKSRATAAKHEDTAVKTVVGSLIISGVALGASTALTVATAGLAAPLLAVSAGSAATGVGALFFAEHDAELLRRCDATEARIAKSREAIDGKIEGARKSENWLAWTSILTKDASRAMSDILTSVLDLESANIRFLMAVRMLANPFDGLEPNEMGVAIQNNDLHEREKREEFIVKLSALKFALNEAIGL